MRKYLIALSTAFVTILSVSQPAFALTPSQMSMEDEPVCGEPRGTHDCE